jgi:hypothetical protein
VCVDPLDRRRTIHGGRGRKLDHDGLIHGEHRSSVIIDERSRHHVAGDSSTIAQIRRSGARQFPFHMVAFIPSDEGGDQGQAECGPSFP